MTDFFKYDFGYAWPWSYGHLVAAIVFVLVAALARKLAWPRWIAVVSMIGAAWAAVAFVTFDAALSRPAVLPTPRFLQSGAGRVLDGGAGSGRSTLMVLLSRPRATVVALDLFREGYGIAGNAPDRLRANARAAGVEDRLEIRPGDLRQMPFAPDSFDAAVSAFAIDHLGRKGAQQAIGEMARVLRPNGQFLLMVIQRDGWVQFAYPLINMHMYYGSRGAADTWRSWLASAGFEVVEQGTQPATLYFLAEKRAARAAEWPTVVRSATRGPLSADSSPRLQLPPAAVFSGLPEARFRSSADTR